VLTVRVRCGVEGCCLSDRVPWWRGRICGNGIRIDPRDAPSSVRLIQGSRSLFEGIEGLSQSEANGKVGRFLVARYSLTDELW